MIPVGHVEAGLRTFNKYNPFPEEMNRKLVSSLADLHFAPTRTSADNLLKEAVNRNSIFVTGNTVIDALFSVAGKPFDLSKAVKNINKDNRKIILVTTHRRESFGVPMRNTCKAIAFLAGKYKEDLKFVIPVHRNPKVRQTVNEILFGIENVIMTEPLDYIPFVHLMKCSYLVLTDSGGVQEEAPSFGKPVLVLRETTERPEAVEAGTVKIVGTDPDLIIAETEKLLLSKEEYDRMAKAVNPYGDGKASERIVQALLGYFGYTDTNVDEFVS
jgi:UDP-N-acetylglucosamine 2-epimerase (non-hydrolysing)